MKKIKYQKHAKSDDTLSNIYIDEFKKEIKRINKEARKKTRDIDSAIEHGIYTATEEMRKQNKSRRRKTLIDEVTKIHAGYTVAIYTEQLAKIKSLGDIMFRKLCELPPEENDTDND